MSLLKCKIKCKYKRYPIIEVSKLKASQSILARRHQGTPVISSSAEIFIVGLKKKSHVQIS